jgi:hypothetical protein
MKFLVLVIAVLISFSAAGQADLLEKKGGKFYYKGKVYKREYLGSVYTQSPEAYRLFKSGIKNNTRAKIFGLTGAGLIGGGILLAVIIDSIATLTIGAGAIVLGVISADIALVFVIKGHVRLKKAFNTFNHEMIEKHGYQTDTSLNFGVTNNGLGFVYQF